MKIPLPFFRKESVHKRKNIYEPGHEISVGGRVKNSPAPKTNTTDLLRETICPAQYKIEDGPVLGLKIDVRTHKAFKNGIPRILDMLEEHGCKATFYLPFGVDRSGLIPFYILNHPSQMISSLKAGKHKGYDLRTLLSGTVLPSRKLASGFTDIVSRIRSAGHELGIGPWDPNAWRFGGQGLSEEGAAQQLSKSYDAFIETVGEHPQTSSSPSWLCSDESLIFQSKIGLLYCSDCRGYEPFLPFVEAIRLKTPQVPTTLPVIEEALLSGSHNDARSFYLDLPGAIKDQDWPVFNARAEAEGMQFSEEFPIGLKALRDKGCRVTSLRQLLATRLQEDEDLPLCTMSYGLVDGRPTSVSLQLFDI